MNSGNRMQRHKRAFEWLKPRFFPTASGYNGLDTPSSVGPSSTSLANNPPPASSPTTNPSSAASPPPVTPVSSSSSSSSSLSSLSSSSSSTSSSSSSSSTSTLSTPPPATPPPSSPSTSPAANPVYSLPSVSHSSSATGAASSGSSSPTPSSGISTGALVGGIAAGIIGVAGIAFAIIYFVRRAKRREDDSHFDSDVFKRQSAMLANDDLPASPASRGLGGYNPRPPTMIERHIANGTPVSSMGPTNGYPYPQYADYNAQYIASGYNSPGFQPGQVISPNSASPFYSPYGEPTSVPPSPMGNPYGDPSYQPSQAAYLSRQPSAANNLGAPRADAHYVDLSRSSVTPFQAAQYQEISRQLDSPALGAVPEGHHEPNQSPFADPAAHLGITPPSAARINSVPPSLPEFSPSPMSPVNPEFQSGDKGPSPPVAAYVPTANKRPDTVYTLYDDDDAYA